MWHTSVANERAGFAPVGRVSTGSAVAAKGVDDEVEQVISSGIRSAVELPEEADQGEYLVGRDVGAELRGCRAGVQECGDGGEDAVVLLVVELCPCRCVKDVREGVLLAAERGELVEPGAEGRDGGMVDEQGVSCVDESVEVLPVDLGE